MTQEIDSGKFLYGIFGNTCVIKAIGKITYKLGVTFDLLISRTLSDNAINDFIIDLTETDYIDSTNLGLLARIQVFSSAKFSKRPTLISSNDAINNILQSLGFDRLFQMVIVPRQRADDLKELPLSIKDGRSLEEVLLSAHQYLMDMNTRNAIVFRDVVDLFERDVGKNHSSN